jgi:hypothetical protein
MSRRQRDVHCHRRDTAQAGVVAAAAVLTHEPDDDEALDAPEVDDPEVDDDPESQPTSNNMPETIRTCSVRKSSEDVFTE